MEVCAWMYVSVVQVYTVSPVEKLVNRTTGTHPVRSRCGHGTVSVRSRCTVVVWSRFGRGMVAVRHVIQCSMLVVRSRYSLGSLVIRYTQGSLPPSILDAPRTWYMYCSFYCSNRAIVA